MFFEESELLPKKIQVTPRICDGGELLALWIVAYGKSAATHLWDIGVSRSFCNTTEIEIAIASEMLKRGCDRLTAVKAMILKSGLYEVKPNPSNKESLEVSADLASSLKSAADKQGITVEQYIQNLVKKNQEKSKLGDES